MGTTIVKALQCNICLWVWLPKKSSVRPKKCANPSCGSSRWDTGRRRKIKFKSRHRGDEPDVVDASPVPMVSSIWADPMQKFNPCPDCAVKEGQKHKTWCRLSLSDGK